MNLTTPQSRAFSLVEMLVVIAVIGIVSAIAVPQISSFNEAATEARAQRNAQNLSAVAAQGSAAGITFVGVNAKNQAMANIIAGASPPMGAFAGKYFGVPNMQFQEAQEASEYLDVRNERLIYVPDGGQTAITSLPASNM